MDSLTEKLVNAFSTDMNLFFQIAKDATHPICRMITETQNLFRTPNADREGFLEKFTEVDLSQESREMCFFFYLWWFYFDLFAYREEEAVVVIQKMGECLTDHSNPNLRAEYLVRKASVDKATESEKYFLEGLQLFEHGCPLKRTGFMNYIDEYSLYGHINLVDHKYFDEIDPDFLNLFFFNHCVENGQIEKAIVYKEKVLNSKIKLPLNIEKRFQDNNQLLQFYMTRKCNDENNLWLMSTQCLLEQDVDRALFYAKERFEKVHDNSISSFARLDLVRAQLANGNIEAVERLLQSRVLNSSLLSNPVIKAARLHFYFCRMELIKNNEKKAAQYFSEAYQLAKKMNALTRFDLEIDLSVELKGSQLRFLMDYALTSGQQNFNRPEVLAFASTHQLKGVDRLLGKDQKTVSLKDEIKKYANTNIPILILGETGVGKEEVARASHEESTRKDQPFLAVNCSAIADTLLQSELFGHKSGAYTGASRDRKGIFEEAGEGTVFLDEIGDISQPLQVALLRVLESGEYRPVGSSKPKPIHCRILAATNAHLEKKVEDGLFRKDLWYRLKRLEIFVPSLKERGDDVLVLAEHFLNHNKVGGIKSYLSQKLIDALKAYDWPGNIRELKNEMEKMCILNTNKTFFTLEEANFLRRVPSPTKKKNEDTVTNEKTSNSSPQNHGYEITRSTPYFKRIAIIKKMFETQKELTRKEIQLQTSIPDLTLGKYLKTLQKENFISKVEPTKSPRTHYFRLKN